MCIDTLTPWIIVFVLIVVFQCSPGRDGSRYMEVVFCPVGTPEFNSRERTVVYLVYIKQPRYPGSVPGQRHEFDHFNLLDSVDELGRLGRRAYTGHLDPSVRVSSGAFGLILEHLGIYYRTPYETIGNGSTGQ